MLMPFRYTSNLMHSKLTESHNPMKLHDNGQHVLTSDSQQQDRLSSVFWARSCSRLWSWWRSTSATLCEHPSVHRLLCQKRGLLLEPCSVDGFQCVLSSPPSECCRCYVEKSCPDYLRSPAPFQEPVLHNFGCGFTPLHCHNLIDDYIDVEALTLSKQPCRITCRM